uniref:Uncharacterized protein n=2 Tax=Opuntia streptacantha TaxID=393608 RepID=A0A7C9CLM4_OPUST
MNRWDIQQSALMVGCGEMDAPIAVSQSSNRRGPVVCPKPRRLGFLANDLTMSLRWQRSGQPAEICDSKAGAELLDIILMKEGYGEDLSSREMASSPPFFCGTPPSRVSNPLVHDANFGDEKLSPLSTLQLVSPSSSASPSMSPSAMKAGGARVKFGLKPASVRVEGFDCLSRDRQNSGITAVA